MFSRFDLAYCCRFLEVLSAVLFGMIAFAAVILFFYALSVENSMAAIMYLFLIFVSFVYFIMMLFIVRIGDAINDIKNKICRETEIDVTNEEEHEGSVL